MGTPKEAWQNEPHIKTGDRNVDAVVQKHSFRVKQGLHKYGVTTERADLTLTEWLTHLQEELMDAAVYVERLMVELKDAAERTNQGR